MSESALEPDLMSLLDRRRSLGEPATDFLARRPQREASDLGSVDSLDAQSDMSDGGIGSMSRLSGSIGSGPAVGSFAGDRGSLGNGDLLGSFIDPRGSVGSEGLLDSVGAGPGSRGSISDIGSLVGERSSVASNGVPAVDRAEPDAELGQNEAPANEAPGNEAPANAAPGNAAPANAAAPAAPAPAPGDDWEDAGAPLPVESLSDPMTNLFPPTQRRGSGRGRGRWAARLGAGIRGEASTSGIPALIAAQAAYNPEILPAVGNGLASLGATSLANNFTSPLPNWTMFRDIGRSVGVAAEVFGRRAVAESGEQPTDIARPEREEFARTAQLGRNFRAQQQAMKSGTDEQAAISESDANPFPTARAIDQYRFGGRRREHADDIGEERAGVPQMRRDNPVANFFDTRRLNVGARHWWRDALTESNVVGKIARGIGNGFMGAMRATGRFFKSTWQKLRSWASPAYRERLNDKRRLKNSILNGSFGMAVGEGSVAEARQAQAGSDAADLAEVQGLLGQAPGEGQPGEAQPGAAQPGEAQPGEAQAAGQVAGGVNLESALSPELERDLAYNSEVKRQQSEEDEKIAAARADVEKHYAYRRGEQGMARLALSYAHDIGREATGGGPLSVASVVSTDAASKLFKAIRDKRAKRRDMLRPDLTQEEWSEAARVDMPATRQKAKVQEAHALRNSPALQRYLQDVDAKRAAMGKESMAARYQTDDMKQAVDEYRETLPNLERYEPTADDIANAGTRRFQKGFALRNVVRTEMANRKLGTQVAYMGHRPTFDYTMEESAAAEKKEAIREANPKPRPGEAEYRPMTKPDGTQETQEEFQARWKKQNAGAVRFVDREDAADAPAGEEPITQTKSQLRKGKLMQGLAAGPRAIDALGQIIANEDQGIDDLHKGNDKTALLKAGLSTLRNVAVGATAQTFAAGTPGGSYVTYPIVDAIGRVGGGLLSGIGRVAGDVTGLEKRAKKQDNINLYNRHWFGQEHFVRKPGENADGGQEPDGAADANANPDANPDANANPNPDANANANAPARAGELAPIMEAASEDEEDLPSERGSVPGVVADGSSEEAPAELRDAPMQEEEKSQDSMEPAVEQPQIEQAPSPKHIPRKLVRQRS